MKVNENLKKLRKIIREKGSLVIAFSGGVDSSLITKIAFDELKDQSIAVTIDSDTFSRRELDISKKVAREIGISHKILKISELENEEFRQNPVDRCYHCKKEEIKALKSIAAQYGFRHIAFGVNVSDFGEHRPGIKALNEEGFFQPLVEAGIKKDMIAGLSKELGLSNYNLPSTTCLASRIPYGESITSDKLKQIEAAESFLFSIGLQQSRVRNYNQTARIEVYENEIQKIVEYKHEVVSKLKELGFTYITLDLEGYRSGSMNAVL